MDWDTWLDNDSTEEQIDALCRPASDAGMKAVEVNASVNGWRSNGPDVLEANWSRVALSS